MWRERREGRTAHVTCSAPGRFRFVSVSCPFPRRQGARAPASQITAHAPLRGGWHRRRRAPPQGAVTKRKRAPGGGGGHVLGTPRPPRRTPLPNGAAIARGACTAGASGSARGGGCSWRGSHRALQLRGGRACAGGRPCLKITSERHARAPHRPHAQPVIGGRRGALGHAVDEAQQRVRGARDARCDASNRAARPELSDRGWGTRTMGSARPARRCHDGGGRSSP